MAVSPQFGPRMGQRLEFRQSQALVMTPQLRQAIKLLQFSNQEVSAFVEEELERNPLLERDERPDIAPERPAVDQIAPLPQAVDCAAEVSAVTLPEAGAGPLDVNPYDADNEGGWAYAGRGGSPGFEGDERGLEEMAEARPSLRDHLITQLRLSFGDPVDRLIGAQLIGMLDPAGRVAVESGVLAEALGTDPAQVERVRETMQRFDPPGLFARDLRECLAAQLADRNRLDPAMQALLDNLELLGRRDLRRLMQLCGVDAEDLADMIAEIRLLDPKPAAGWDEAPPQPVVPDVLMRMGPKLEEGATGWSLELNPETLPKVLVSAGFHARLQRGSGRNSREDRLYIAEQLSTANWLVKSLQQRAATILKVAAEIMRQQDGFLRLGVGHLRPLILRDIAEAVEMHESTVSRVTSNKYIATPRGVFELKFFFTTAIPGLLGETHSAEAVRHRIRAMVGAETAEDVLSDDAIVVALRREGVDIARRTVAKYREALRIPSSVQRKKEKALPA